MEEINVNDAQSRLLGLIEQVKQTGQSYTLVKDGQPYADLVPHQSSPRPVRPQAEVLAELDEIRREISPTSIDEIRSAIR